MDPSQTPAESADISATLSSELPLDLLTPTQTITTTTSSDDLELFDPSYLNGIEDPVADLLARSIGDMTDEEVKIMLEELASLNQKPGELQRRLSEEAVVIKTGTKRTSSKKNAIKASQFI